VVCFGLFFSDVLSLFFSDVFNLFFIDVFSLLSVMCSACFFFFDVHRWTQLV
jgi:hypothetical protein